MVISTRPLIDVCPVVPAAMAGRQIGAVGQGLLRGRRLPQDRPAGAGDALGGRALRGRDRARPRRAGRPLAHPAGRRADLPLDPRRQDDRRLSDREPRADADAAPHPAPRPRRPDRAGGPGATRPDPGRRRPPLHRAPQGAARGPRLRGPLPPPAAGACSCRHARHDRLPGAGDRGGDGAGGLQLRGGRGAAAGDEPAALRGGDPRPPRALRRRGGGARRPRRGRRAHLGADPGLLGLWLPQGPLGRLRPARLPVGLPARALRAGVPLRAAERAADGLLPARLALAGGAPARRAAGRHRRQPQRGALPGRARRGRAARGAGRPLLRQGDGSGGDGGAGGRARARRPLPHDRRAGLALGRGAREPRAPRLGGGAGRAGARGGGGRRAAPRRLLEPRPRRLGQGSGRRGRSSRCRWSRRPRPSSSRSVAGGGSSRTTGRPG